MKGKGKSAHHHHHHHHHQQQQEKEKEKEKECPLQFPDLTTVNHEEECKRYTAILGRAATETVSVEELDSVQTDLELLLASVGRRLKLLKSEIQILQNWQDKKDAKSAPATPAVKGKGQSDPPSSATKRGKGASSSSASSSSTSDERPSKKFKDSSGKVAPPPSTPGVASSPVPRSKSKLPQVKTEPESASSPAELPRVLKNECVDRFWQAMESYCRPITDDDVKFLEEQIQKIEDEESTFFKIPPLGRHYRDVWAEEDLLEEMAEGGKVNDKKRHGNHTNSHNSHPYPNAATNGSNGATDASALLKKAEHSLEDSPFGPLTQRLVSALLEENMMTPMDDVITDLGDNAEEGPAISPRALAKQLNITNPSTLERRIQKELEEQGILEPEEEVADDPSDEILTELKGAQSQLKPLLQWKAQHLTHLLKKAREQQARQTMWKKFEEWDVKLHEEYRKLNAARLKKKPNLKRERESVRKVLKEWWALYQSLDNSYGSQ